MASWAWFDCYLPWGAFAELDVFVLLTGVNALLFVHWTLVSRWFSPLFSLGHWRSRGLPSCGSPSSCSSTCSRGFLFVRFPLGSCRLLARRVCPLSSPPVEGFVFVLCWFPFLVPAFVELVLLLAGASVAPGSGCLVLPGLRRFPRSFGIWAVLRQLPELRSTRQVERFAACSFRHLPQVVSHPGG